MDAKQLRHIAGIPGIPDPLWEILFRLLQLLSPYKGSHYHNWISRNSSKGKGGGFKKQESTFLTTSTFRTTISFQWQLQKRKGLQYTKGILRDWTFLSDREQSLSANWELCFCWVEQFHFWPRIPWKGDHDQLGCPLRKNMRLRLPS